MSFAAPLVDNKILVELVRDKSKVPGKDYLVVDVRDDDFEGGNIPGAINVPSGELLDHVHHIINKYHDVPQVFFHCALSQVRGPKSARIYNESKSLIGQNAPQEVMVLRGGYEEWFARYHDQPDLIESHAPVKPAFDDKEDEDDDDNPYLAGIPKSSS